MNNTVEAQVRKLVLAHREENERRLRAWDHCLKTVTKRRRSSNWNVKSEKSRKRIRPRRQKKEFDEAASGLRSNLDFAERLNLISEEQAYTYRQRIKKAALEREEAEVAENEVCQESGESRNGRRGRFMSMREMQADIARERAKINDRQAHDEKERAGSTKDEDGRMRVQ